MLRCSRTGFVRFRLRPSVRLEEGDSVQNKAEIFFDYNAPIVTNTAITYIRERGVPVSVRDYHTYASVSVYPNPASQQLWIKSYRPSTFSLYNVLGEAVKTLNINGEIHLDVFDLKEGIYFYKINDGTVHKLLIKR